jgi:hypothetical protein
MVLALLGAIKRIYVQRCVAAIGTEQFFADAATVNPVTFRAQVP